MVLKDLLVNIEQWRDMIRTPTTVTHINPSRIHRNLATLSALRSLVDEEENMNFSEGPINAEGRDMQRWDGEELPQDTPRTAVHFSSPPTTRYNSKLRDDIGETDLSENLLAIAQYPNASSVHSLERFEALFTILYVGPVFFTSTSDALLGMTVAHAVASSLVELLTGSGSCEGQLLDEAMFNECLYYAFSTLWMLLGCRHKHHWGNFVPIAQDQKATSIGNEDEEGAKNSFKKMDIRNVLLVESRVVDICTCSAASSMISRSCDAVTLALVESGLWPLLLQVLSTPMPLMDGVAPLLTVRSTWKTNFSLQRCTCKLMIVLITSSKGVEKISNLLFHFFSIVPATVCEKENQSSRNVKLAPELLHLLQGLTSKLSIPRVSCYAAHSISCLLLLVKYHRYCTTFPAEEEVAKKVANSETSHIPVYAETMVAGDLVEQLQQELVVCGSIVELATSALGHRLHLINNDIQNSFESRDAESQALLPQDATYHATLIVTLMHVFGAGRVIERMRRCRSFTSPLDNKGLQTHRLWSSTMCLSPSSLEGITPKKQNSMVPEISMRSRSWEKKETVQSPQRRNENSRSVSPLWFTFLAQGCVSLHRLLCSVNVSLDILSMEHQDLVLCSYCPPKPSSVSTLRIEATEERLPSSSKISRNNKMSWSACSTLSIVAATGAQAECRIVVCNRTPIPRQQLANVRSPQRQSSALHFDLETDGTFSNYTMRCERELSASKSQIDSSRTYHLHCEKDCSVYIAHGHALSNATDQCRDRSACFDVDVSVELPQPSWSRVAEEKKYDAHVFFGIATTGSKLIVNPNQRRDNDTLVQRSTPTLADLSSGREQRRKAAARHRSFVLYRKNTVAEKEDPDGEVAKSSSQNTSAEAIILNPSHETAPMDLFSELHNKILNIKIKDLSEKLEDATQRHKRSEEGRLVAESQREELLVLVANLRTELLLTTEHRVTPLLEANITLKKEHRRAEAERNVAVGVVRNLNAQNRELCTMISAQNDAIRQVVEIITSTRGVEER